MLRQKLSQCFTLVPFFNCQSISLKVCIKAWKELTTALCCGCWQRMGKDKTSSRDACKHLLNDVLAV